MASTLSIPQIIQLGKVSSYLAANYSNEQSLYVGSLIQPVSPVQISFVTDGLEWAYDGGAQSTEDLREVANYLYWICGKFQLEAQNIIYGPGGGTVIPITPGAGIPNPLDFEVTVSSFISAGETTKNIPQFIGYNVDFFRNSLTQYTTPTSDGSTYYSWNKVTGDFTLYNGAASVGEFFRISPTL